MEHKYIFSIVMAIYNNEPFLRETLDSIVNQDLSKFEIPFEEIVQVIMVDDGSTDGTDKIISEYAAAHPNFLAVHKENDGVASARNEGLKYVEGKYMNFLDCHDKFSSNVLWEIYNFFETHYEDTDIVTMPLFFFDAAEGAHWQNGKFNKGNRIINLFEEYDASLMLVNASFFKSEYNNKVFFDDKLVYGEDIKYIFTILSNKMTLGVIKNCKYYYRICSAGEESPIQYAKEKTGWYFDYFDNLVEWAFKFSINKFGFVAQYIQNLIAKDLSWRFKEKYETIALSLLGKQNFERYQKQLYKYLKNFDDDIIFNQKHIYIEHKIFMLEKKYGHLPDLIECNNDLGLFFDEKPVFWVSNFVTYIDFLHINQNTLTVEGYTMIAGISDDEPIEVGLVVKKNNTYTSFIVCDIVQKRNVNQYRFNETLFRGIPFIGKVVLNDGETKAEISIAVVVRGITIIKKDIRYKRFAPISKEYKKNYYIKDGYMITEAWNHIYFEKCNASEKKLREKNFMTELKSSKNESDKKAYKALTALKLFEKIKHKQIWLISDRVNKADDNGEAFFRYLCETKPKGIDFYFVIGEDSTDYERIKKIGKVVSYFSHKHKMLHLLADVVISSQINVFVNPFQNFFPPYRRFISNQRYVFLQHGITKDDQSSTLHKYDKNLFGFVTSTHSEYQSILDNNYFYNSSEVWLTGMPRYDLLYNSPQKYVTIMPTWRSKIMRYQSGIWYPKSETEFKSSDYYCFYNELINSKKLISAAKELGYTICFFPHANIQICMDYFEKNDSVVFWGLDKSYREVFAESDMIITDFSSAAFDFAYLKKPLIYSQFDVDTFYEYHSYDKGYFDYERDGFGEVTYDLDSTVDMIIEYMKNGCRLKDKYRERIDNFFAFNDRNNCQRVYEKIVEMLEEK